MRETMIICLLLNKKVYLCADFFKRMTNMTIEDIQALIHGDETRTLELKKTTGELKDGIRSVCAFLNTAGGWLFFGIAPTTLKILGQEVTDNTRKEIAREIAKLEPLIDLPVEYIDVPDRPGCQPSSCFAWLVFGVPTRMSLSTTSVPTETSSLFWMLAWHSSSSTSLLAERLLVLRERRNWKFLLKPYVKP